MKVQKTFCGVFVAAALFALLNPVAAQQTPKAEPPKNNCELLAQFEPWMLRKQFEQVVGEVIGKRVERWTAEDFQSVVAAAVSCDRFVSVQRREVRGGAWAAQMEAAAKVIIPVSMAIRKADDDMNGALATAPWLPECMSLLEWRRNRMSWKNNSVEVFGTDLLAMDRKNIDLTKQRAAACKPALNLIAKARRAGDDVGTMIAEDIAYAADRSIEALSEERGEKTITAMDGDHRIPLAYTSQKARMMIGIVSRANKIGRPMTADETTELTAWADQTISKSGNDADVAYAKVVKDNIAKQIFRREE